MIRAGWRFALALAALTAISCAGPEKLSIKSREALEAGRAQDAYDEAARALKKDPTYAPGREALGAAAKALIRQRQSGIATAGEGRDTAVVGQRILALDRFRREVREYGVQLAADTTFEVREDQLRNSAAAFHYRRGRGKLEAGTPRLAYPEFLTARDLVPGYRDVETLVRESYAQSLSHVAIMPFANQTDLAGFTREIYESSFAALADHITPSQFKFTVLLDKSDVLNRLTVAELDRMERADALRVGRAVGADLVVTGRIYGLHTDGQVDRLRNSIFRKVTETDPKTHETTVSFEEQRMDYVVRERSVAMTWEFTVLDARTGEVIATHSSPVSYKARTYYTDFLAEGDPEEYSLYTPEMEKTKSPEVQKINTDYKSRMGKLKLKDVLQTAQKERHRQSYKPDYRGEFNRNTWEYPVYLGELPPDRELAFIALGDVWRPILSELKDLDKH